MGGEYAFLFFTDHHAELGTLVTEGRRQNSPTFPGSLAMRFPTRNRLRLSGSQFRWDEVTNGPHAGMLRLYKSLLHLRRTIRPRRRAKSPNLQIEALDDVHAAANGTCSSAVIRLQGNGTFDLHGKVILAILFGIPKICSFAR